MNIDTIDVSVSRHTSNLLVNFFFRLSHLPGNCVSICYLSYMCSGTVVKGALFERIGSAGMSLSRLLADDINSMVTQKYKKVLFYIQDCGYNANYFIPS